MALTLIGLSVRLACNAITADRTLSPLDLLTFRTACESSVSAARQNIRAIFRAANRRKTISLKIHAHAHDKVHDVTPEFFRFAPLLVLLVCEEGITAADKSNDK
jgi:hypothetical protein